jgi:hypothetical protein
LLLPSAALAAEPAAEPFSALHEALAQLAKDNAAPEHTAIGGDWTVFTLARAGLWQQSSTQAAAYYERLVQSVDQAASKTVRQDGALHDLKSTDNARTILALTALGKDPHDVGGWDLLRPYEDFSWIKKQSYNAIAYALLALNSGGYETADPTIRTQCVDYLVQSQFDDGGWSIWGDVSDVDITAIVLQGLAPYRDDPAVAAVGDRGFALLSAAQKENGNFATIGAENTESAAQVVLACCAWGIDPAADARLQKNGVTPIDCLLNAWQPEARAFVHTQDSQKWSVQASEQATYALLAYDRLLKGQPFLFDCTDVTPAAEEPMEEPTTEPPTEPTVPTEAAAETPTAPVTTKATPTTTEAVTEITTTKPAAEPTTAKPTTTAAPATTAARKEATPHTGEVSFVLPAALTLLLACAVLSLLKKREVRHAA